MLFPYDLVGGRSIVYTAVHEALEKNNNISTCLAVAFFFNTESVNYYCLHVLYLVAVG
jgi:hypothetical protein